MSKWKTILAIIVVFAWPVFFTLAYDAWVVSPTRFEDQAKYMEAWTAQANELNTVKTVTGKGFVKMVAVCESLAKGFVVCTSAISEIDARVRRLEKNRCHQTVTAGERWDR